MARKSIQNTQNHQETGKYLKYKIDTFVAEKYKKAGQKKKSKNISFSLTWKLISNSSPYVV